MSRVIRAHFDGRVFIPDEPVDAPVNQPLQLWYENGKAASQHAPEQESVAARLRALKSIAGIVTGPPIDPESLRRENLYDDRL
jgi:hypothetical protein